MPDDHPHPHAARAAALAHELANVLGVVVGVAELLERELAGTDHGPDVARIRAAAARGVEALGGLRALAEDLAGG